MTTPAPPDRGLRRRFFLLAAINIVSNVTVPVAGLVDTAMLGHLPDIRFLAGVALAALLFDYVFWSFGFLRMGTTGTTAQAVGRGETDEVYRVLYRSLALAAGLGAVIVILQVPLAEAGFAILGGAADVEAAGRDYFYARVWGAPAALANFAFLGWFLGREESGRALAMTAVANVVNVVLDWYFILRLGWAAEGAGWATMASQWASLATAVWLLRRASRAEAGGRMLPGWDRGLVLDRGRLASLLRLNRDILVRTLCLVSAFAVFTDFSSLLGTTVLAANAILLRLVNLASYAIDGIAFATESLAGIFRGGGRSRDLRRLTRLALASGLAFAALFLAAVLAAPGAILGVLTSHPEVLAAAHATSVWLVPVLLAGSIAYVYDGLFLGLTAGRPLRNSMLASTLLVFLPVATLALHLGSSPLLWLALSLFMAARAATLGWASRTLLAAG